MIVAIPYWAGDEERALTLARLLARLEAKKRDDDWLVLARRFDCPLSAEAERTQEFCQRAFGRVMFLRSTRLETGHPDGCFGLWAGTMAALSEMLQNEAIPWLVGRDVFVAESDGVPLRRAWLDSIKTAHALTKSQHKRITGAVMEMGGGGWMYHVNGGAMALCLQLWEDYPSLKTCPNGVAWDIHHAVTLLRETRDSRMIMNVCGSVDWTPGVLKYLGCESAWLHGVKDDSALKYALTLIERNS